MRINLLPIPVRLVRHVLLRVGSVNAAGASGGYETVVTVSARWDETWQELKSGRMQNQPHLERIILYNQHYRQPFSAEPGLRRTVLR